MARPKLGVEGLQKVITAPTPTNRLAFLGDAVLGLIVAEELFRRRPDWVAADLAQGREHVVSARALATAGRRAGLDQQIRGDPPEGGWPDRILANVIEALVATAYLEGGLSAARVFVLRTLAEELREALMGRMQRHPKSLLLELTQRLWQVKPEYRLLPMAQEQPGYRVEVEAGPLRAEGSGRSRRAAESAAARAALVQHREVEIRRGVASFDKPGATEE